MNDRRACHAMSEHSTQTIQQTLVSAVPTADINKTRVYMRPPAQVDVDLEGVCKVICRRWVSFRSDHGLTSAFEDSHSRAGIINDTRTTEGLLRPMGNSEVRPAEQMDHMVARDEQASYYRPVCVLHQTSADTHSPVFHLTITASSQSHR
jgi:hypothetical protein